MEKRKINAKIVADSINPQGNRITTFLLTYPRFIHGELMTHRMFSRNSASSRAIPFEKMVKMVEDDPFVPIAWQIDHKGMQGTEYLTGDINIEEAVKIWLEARDYAVGQATKLSTPTEYKASITKQICNRLLEPYMWHTVLVTATEWENFFALRCPQYKHISDITGTNQVLRSKKDWLFVADDGTNRIEEHNRRLEENPLLWFELNQSQAEIHIQALAESMWDAMNESTPKELKAGEWHIPFGDKIDYALHKWNFLPNIIELWGKDMSEYGIKIATARCARLSYMTFDNEIDYQKDITLHDILLKSKHASPFEHCARAMSDHEYKYFIKGQLIDCESDGDWQEDGRWEDVFIENKNTGWCNNFRGFIPYRYLVETNGNLV